MRKSKKAPVDNSLDQPIVEISQSNNETPLGGVGSTDQGLTTHAERTSMEAAGNPISALSSRQLQSSAVDDFFVGEAAERKLPETSEPTTGPIEITPNIYVVSDSRAGAGWIRALQILTQAVIRKDQG